MSPLWGVLWDFREIKTRVLKDLTDLTDVSST